MGSKTWFEKITDNYMGTDDYNLEMIKLNIVEQISQIMTEKNISKIKFAKMMETSPAYVTKLLSGETNFTIDTIYKISKVLNSNIEVNTLPETIIKESSSESLIITSEYKPQQQFIVSKGKFINQAKTDLSTNESFN